MSSRDYHVTSAPPSGPPPPARADGHFRRSVVVEADAAGAPPPPSTRAARPSDTPVPTGADTEGGKRRRHKHRHSKSRDAEDREGMASERTDETQEKPRESHRASSDAREDGERSRHRHRKSSSRGEEAGAPPQEVQTTSSKAPLTADAIDRAFGSVIPTNGGGVSGGFVRPTAKEGSDAVSVYSASQSILPQDPRDRLYYRPRRHLLQCYMQRRQDRTASLLKSVLSGKNMNYYFYMEHTNEFVLAAAPRALKAQRTVMDQSDGIQGQQYTVKQGPSNVLFSINEEQMTSDPTSYVGKSSIRAAGLETVLYSEGDANTRKEIAAVYFDTAEDGQRRFHVILPAIDEDTGFIRPLEGGEVKFLRDGRGTSVYGGSRAGIDLALLNSDDEDTDAPSMTPSQAPTFTAQRTPDGSHKVKKWRSHSLLVREFLAQPGSPNIIVLKNKEAAWDNALRGYRLDFHGRATKGSQKNFQLVSVREPEKVVMLFGKQDNDRFAVDFRYPLCGLQAAAVATAMMDLNSHRAKEGTA